MQTASEAIQGQFGRLQKISGTCEPHGTSEVLHIPGKGGWYCPQCLEARQAQESRDNWARERLKHLRNVADIPRKYAGQKFVAVTPEQKAVRSLVKSFRDLVVKRDAWATLVLMGAVGTGKTLLACEFAESLMTNFDISTRYVTAKQMISEIQASYSMEGRSEAGEVQRFVEYEVLIIDEIDAIPARDNAALLLTEIINQRYNAERPVVVITNQPFSDLAKFVGDRVHSRLHENAFICAFDWADFRRAA